MIIANRPLNFQAIAIEEAETQIRKTVKEEFFKLSSKSIIDKKVFSIIKIAEQNIKLPVLKEAAIKSLLNFYNRQYEELQRSFMWQFSFLSALFLLQNKTLSGTAIKPTTKEINTAKQTLFYNGYDPVKLYGTALQKFSKEYIESNVKPAIDRLAEQFALDPDDVSGRNSLRNRAEMEVRYNDHLQKIEELKKSHKLVIASTHADCSERCAPWQGRVYSLDGTSGVTDDGRKYVPLEEATDIYYTTKAGKTYKNGLLGFNCRHFLVPYKSGYKFPKPDKKTERKEYDITLKQRELERNVRKWRTKAIESQGINEEEYKMARKKAIEWNKTYIQFSQKNNRAYYPSRTKIL